MKLLQLQPYLKLPLQIPTSMNSFPIHDWRKRKPVMVRSYTRGGKPGFVLSLKLFIRKATVLSLVATIIVTSYISTFFLGALLAPHVVEAGVSGTPVLVVPPVMQRIAHCESRGNQYCSDDAVAHGLCKAAQKGQVLQRANTNGTIDTGKYQLNSSYWGAELSAHGFDITKEKDNEAAALYIYENHGTGPWSASLACWK